MNAATEQMIANQLSQRLKHETATEHERMHKLMAEAAVFRVKSDIHNSPCHNTTFRKRLNIFSKSKAWRNSFRI